MLLTLAELGAHCGCPITGDPDTPISSAAAIESARPGSLVFALNDRLLAAAELSPASAVVAPAAGPPCHKPCLRTNNVRLTWALALERLYPPTQHPPAVHPSASVDAAAMVSPEASIGPHCTLGAGSRIGDRCILGPGVVIGLDAVVESDSVLHANVVIGDRCIIGERNTIYAGAVVGADGFGFARDGVRHHRIPHIGIVRTGCDVEIGANSTIDRAALGETLIADGVKLDNLVMVAHNVSVGSHTIVAAQTGIAGSARIGSRVIMGGQVGIADHVTVGEGAALAGQAGVIGDVAPGAVLVGFPARPRREFMRSAALLARLPALLRRAGIRLHGPDKDPDTVSDRGNPIAQGLSETPAETPDQ